MPECAPGSPPKTCRWKWGAWKQTVVTECTRPLAVVLPSETCQLGGQVARVPPIMNVAFRLYLAPLLNAVFVVTCSP